jgi:tRNA A-37 threonylcarbamoyl transferase component Bud32
MTNTFTKNDVNQNEYLLHTLCYSLIGNTSINIHIPKIISYDRVNRCLTLEKINGDNLSNIYGEDIRGVPPNIVDIIRNFLRFLCEQGIDYIDITGYNFMLDNHENIWIIDFEHTKIRTEPNSPDEFLSRFINGELSWNPEFK